MTRGRPHRRGRGRGGRHRRDGAFWSGLLTLLCLASLLAAVAAATLPAWRRSS